MKFNDAELFRQQKRAEGATSDGCTLAPEIGTPCCEMHDFLRRFQPLDQDTGKPITPLRADNLLFLCIIEKSKTKGIRASIYWIAAMIYWIVSRSANLLGIYR